MPAKMSAATTALLFLATGAALALFLTREPEPALASTAHGTSKKTMVTVPLDAGMEAVVTLDHITCDLTGYVLDRFSGKFFVQYRYNVASDFKIRQGRPPEFIIGAGQADFRKFNGNERLADGVIYISEANTGHIWFSS